MSKNNISTINNGTQAAIRGQLVTIRILRPERHLPQLNGRPTDSLNYIMVRLLSKIHGEIQFYINSNNTMRRLKKYYCKRLKIDSSTVHFECNGRHMANTDTASSLKITDGDIIEVHHTRSGS